MATHQVAAGTNPKAKIKPTEPKGKSSRKPAAKEVAAPVVEVSAEQREAERRAEEDRRQEERRQAAGNAAIAMAIGQLTAPPQATSEYEQKLAELQKQYGIEAKAASARVPKDARNGITRPGEGTTTGKVWAAADEITVAKGRPAAIAEVKLHASLIGVNDHTIKTQYARWRAYNNVTGRVSAMSAPVKVMTHEGNP